MTLKRGNKSNESINLVASNLNMDDSNQINCRQYVTMQISSNTHLMKSFSTVVIVVDACFSSPCLNGATCEADYGTGNYQCICVTDYTGTRCETCKWISVIPENKLANLRL